MHERAQKKPEHHEPAKPSQQHATLHGKKRLPTITPVDEQNVVDTAADILRGSHETSKIGAALPSYQAALALLKAAYTPSSLRQPQSFATRARALEVAMPKLEPVFASYAASGQMQSAYAADNIETPLHDLHADLHAGALRESTAERVENATIESDAPVVNAPVSHDSRESAALQREVITKVVESIKLSLEFAKSLEAHGKIPKGSKLPGRNYSVDEEVSIQSHVMGGLTLISGLLVLTDDEFMRNLSAAHGFCARVENYTQFVTAITAVIGGTVSSVATLTAAIATITGNAKGVTLLSHVAERTLDTMSDVASGAEVLRSLVMVLDPDSTTEQRIDGAVSIVGNGSRVFGAIGSRVAAEGSVLEVAASAAPIIGDSILIAYETYKLVKELPCPPIAVIGVWMTRSFIRMHEEGLSIATAAERLAKSYALVEHERDPEKSAALLAYIVTAIEGVRSRVDAFLDLCKPAKYSDEYAVEHPGAYKILIEYFQPLGSHRGAKTCDQAMNAAIATLQRIKWALENSASLVKGREKKQPLSEIKHYALQQPGDERKQEKEEKEREQEEEKNGPLEDPGVEWAAA